MQNTLEERRSRPNDDDLVTENIWKHFNKTTDERTSLVAICNVCKDEIQYDVSHSNLYEHLQQHETKDSNNPVKVENHTHSVPNSDNYIDIRENIPVRENEACEQWETVKPANVSCDVWSHFKVYSGNRKPDIAICNYCNNEVKHCRSISVLQKHLKSHGNTFYQEVTPLSERSSNTTTPTPASCIATTPTSDSSAISLSNKGRQDMSAGDEEHREERRLWEKVKPTKTKSSVWNHFKVYSLGRMPGVAICNHCDTEVRGCGSTTNLRLHLKKHKGSFSYDDIEPSTTTRVYCDRSTREERRYWETTSRHNSSGPWQHFRIYASGKMPSVAICNHCDVEVRGSNSLVNLRLHLKKHNIYDADATDEKTEINPSSNQSTVSPSASSPVVTVVPLQSSTSLAVETPSSNFSAKNLLKFIVMTNQSLDICENPYFLNLCYSLNQRALKISKETIISQLLDSVKHLQKSIERVIDNEEIALSVEMWSTRDTDVFLSVKVHFLDYQWKLHELLIDIQRMSGDLSNIDVIHKVHEICRQRNIQPNRVSAIVMRNAPFLLDSSFEWHDCIDHLITTSCDVFFKHDLIRDTLQQGKNLLSFYKYLSKKDFEEIKRITNIQPFDIRDDIATTWWSFSLLCERLIDLKPSITIIHAKSNMYPTLSPHHWKVLELCYYFLKPFVAMYNFLVEQKHILIGYLPLLIDAISGYLQKACSGIETSSRGADEWMDGTHKAVHGYAVEMLHHFRSQWSNISGHSDFRNFTNFSCGLPKKILFAAALDPRTKVLKGIPPDNHEAIWLMIASEVEEIIRQTLCDRASKQSFPVQSVMDAANFQKNLNGMDMWNDPMTIFPPNHSDDMKIAQIARNEVITYRNQSPLMNGSKNESADPLEWWKARESVLPYLSRLARKILAIPATSLPSNRIFTIEGLKSVSENLKLSGEFIEQIAFLRGNWAILELLEANISLQKRKRIFEV